MKRNLSVLLLFLLLVGTAYGQQAKYVFYFIGDGMGLNHVNMTEMYRAEQEGRIGVTPLLLTSFPVTGVATTFSGTNSVTDSAAGGTALAVGEKTYNGAIGVGLDKQPLESVAVWAKRSGKKVGVITSVSIDHATPASFYAHKPDRNMYYEIALDLPKAGFDFYGGSGFQRPNRSNDNKEAPSIFPIFEEAGYTLARGTQEYKEKSSSAQKMILMDRADANQACLPYAIDRPEGGLSLKDITESAVDFLSKNNKKGFFLMVEGGKIDYACHSNDAATALEEVIDMDNALQVAYDFYKKHPKETLIIVTADHETGGLALGAGKYALNLKALACQKQSVEQLSRMITDLRKDGRHSWEDVKALLTERMGFWKDIPLTWEQERTLRDEYEASFVKRKVVFEETLYARTEPLAVAAKKIMSQIALIGWTTPSHSAAYVPVFAIGVGSNLFMGKMDNTDIPHRVAKAAGYKK